MKIIFMGTPDFAVPCLKRLYNENYDIVLVVTKEDKPVGRKQILTPSPVKSAALDLGLLVYQPSTLKSSECLNYLKQFDADFIITAAYGKILPKSVLDSPKHGCINVHGSLLPKYRGSAPIQRCVLSGDKVTGVTIMKMNEGVDTGDILLEKEYPVGANSTSGDIFDALSKLAPDALIEALNKIKDGTIKPKKQDEALATLAPMIKKEEALIDWNKSAYEIHNLIRGMNPWPVAFSYIEDKKVKIYSSELTGETASLPPGSVMTEKGALNVSAGDGKLLKILSLQLEGSKRLLAKEFLLGHKIEKFNNF